MIGDYKYERGEMTDDHLLLKVERGWRTPNGETKCGTGSMKQNARQITNHLLNIIETYDIKSISDAGAGDLNWIQRIDWNIDYQGYDLYPRHKDVVKCDVTKKILRKSDLILCRHVLNHLSIDYVENAIYNFQQSGSKYLLITNCNNQERYWSENNFDLNLELLETRKDCQHWILQLYKL